MSSVGRRSSVFPLVISALVLLFLLGSVSLGAAPLHGTQTAPATASVRVGTLELNLAQASLLHGGGPGPLTPTLEASRGTPAVRGEVAPLHGPPTSYYWNNLSALVGTSPSARIGAAMAYDVSDGYVLLFGGSALGHPLDDTWTYSNGTWTNLTSSVTGSPPALALASMAYDPSTSKVVLFGGENASSVYSGSTWTYHAKVWTNVTSVAGTAPSPRLLPGMATDSADNELLLVGGSALGTVSQTARDTWTYHDGTWANITGTAPISARVQLPSLTDDPAAGGVLLTSAAGNASANTTFYAATFLFHGGTWENLTTYGLKGPALTLSETAQIGYMPAFSGVLLSVGLTFNSSGAEVFSASTWMYSDGSWTNITDRVGAGPGYGLLFSSAVVPGDSSLLVFGGDFLIEGVSSDTWSLSAPPLASASSSSTVTDAGGSLTFTGAAAFGLDPLHGAWKFGDGTSATGFTSAHSYSAAGVFVVTFTVTDLLGENASASTLVVVNAAPTVSASVSPPSPTAGTAAGLVASVAGGTGPYTYSWNLGDGGTATTATVTHTYANSGSFTATVEVTDSVGKTANASVTVVVGSASSTSGFSYTSGMGLVLLIAVLVLLVVAILLGGLLARKGGTRRGPPTQYSGAPPVGPPPGAGGPPPPA
jgi:PKD domain